MAEVKPDVKPDVLIIDTANPFFRGKESPNDETTAGAFFDLLEATPASVKLEAASDRAYQPRAPDDIAGGQCYCFRSDTTEAEKRKMHEPPRWSNRT
jgi:hypothetical protein